VALAWAVLIGILSLLPGDALPPLPPFPGADKLAHAGFYLLLGFLLAWSLHSPSHLALIVLALLIGLYGYSLELGQLYVPGRNYDLLDALANFAGGTLGAGACEIWIHRRTAPAE
jgi:VanZ family protein